jgi:transposase
MDKYIGMDMDCKKIVACVVDAEGREEYATLPPDIGAVRDFLERQKADGSQIHATYEISGQAGWWYDNLSDVADEVKVCNPTKMTWIYRTAKKNDRIDARKMAVLLRIGELPTVYMPDTAVRQWRQMIRHRQDLLCKQTKAKNQIRALLKSQGLSCPPYKGSWWKCTNREWMTAMGTSLADTDSGLWRLTLTGLLEELALLESQVKRITACLDERLGRYPEALLLLSIPGVGPRTAEAVLAYTDDIHRFGNSKQYGSYFGLTPKLDESGSLRRIGHISKQGPAVARWLLVECAWRVIKYSPSLRRFYERVMGGQKQRRKIAIVAVARKITEIMRAMLLSRQGFEELLVGQVLKERCVG